MLSHQDVLLTHPRGGRHGGLMHQVGTRGGAGHVTLRGRPRPAPPKVGEGVLPRHCTQPLGQLLTHLGDGVLVLWGHLVDRLTYGCKEKEPHNL